MKGVAVVLVCVIFSASRAGAQVSVEEAQRRLAERQRERAAQSRPAQSGVATQPAGADAAGDADVKAALREAWGKVMAKDYIGARPVFSGVIAKQASNATALSGRAVCEYELSNYKPSAEDAEKALRWARQEPLVVRQASLAAGAAYVATNRPLRAIRLVMDCMKAQEKANMLDEEMQNVLGAAVWRCKSEMRSMPLVVEAGKYYMAYDAKLARDANTHGPPGSVPMRRWGTQWLPVDEADLKWTTYGNAVAARDKAAADLPAFVVARKNAQMEYNNAHGRTMGSAIENTIAESNLQRATNAETAAREALANAEALLAKTEAPPFPVKLEPGWSEPRVSSSQPSTQPGDF